MGIKIGNIDIANAIIELEFQTKINTIIIENILNQTQHNMTSGDIKDIRRKAADAINEKYGANTITLND
ncbi:hypothetical protein [Gracilimonas sediminicola]|uniref:Uncharacterized protein n=1 Tax=Gracilimonas sediminicola TaxID=2952158 RepID=A0A9X2L3J5_9BACT|nr:hypothetical protein [Gracilimonas sediminicola]MCP9291617.1 hypothetical protein [Gracilimonas sediminicola]